MSGDRLFYVEILKNTLNDKTSFSIEKSNIKESDRAFFNMLMMTTFRNLCFIKDEVLAKFVKKKIAKKQEILEYILYLGAIEILFLETPSYAVINSYVDIAKHKTDKFGANFVNAVLRNIDRCKDELLRNRKTRYFSKEFIDILKKDYDSNEISQMEEFINIEPMLDLTYKNGIEPNFEEGMLLKWGSYRMPCNTKVFKLKGFEKGDFWVQDASSSMAVRVIKDELKDKKVLDMCAAPGGKTAQLLDYGAKVVAQDIAEDRLNILKENIKRVKLDKNLEIRCVDATTFECDEKFDVVLLDAPCSATGTFRRHPEIVHTKTIKDVNKMAKIQEKILNKAVLFLKDNGILVYATCSLAKDEGERQIYKFLEKNKDFVIKKIILKDDYGAITKEGFLRILPQTLKEYFGTDGFFVACLQRKK